MNAGCVEEFERHRGALLALAYRMLGDMGRAEDLVQEAWIRFARAAEEIAAPRAFLAKVVTRLCLNELDSARLRHERSGDGWLPEPVAADPAASDRIERAERVSMALLVALQRLNAAERATLLLADVFGFRHAEIAELLGTSEPTSRQLLRRARAHVAEEKRMARVSLEKHGQLLEAFLDAVQSGDERSLLGLLCEDVVLHVDAGAEGRRWGRVRALRGPLAGRQKVAAFLARVAPQGAPGSEVRPCDVLGEKAALVLRGGVPEAVVAVAVIDGRIARVFIHADPVRLSRLTGGGTIASEAVGVGSRTSEAPSRSR